ncbi:MAG TPA: hypothetical protein VJ306_20440 [Pyrinomonadaceae bacterium]|jgi:hypothetical protein|nr:hypothetical protein [Pyrinomonadaceae bacterium]
MTTILRWILSIVFGSVFLWIGSLNTVIFWKGVILRQKTPSAMPLLAGFCGTVALLIVPLTGVRRWWWIPLLLDWGSLPGILVGVVYHLYMSKVKGIK